MTLGVAAVFPWPALEAALPASVRLVMEQVPTARPSPAILFASDSRWTWENGRTEDGAVKLFAIDANTIAIYAGDVDIGERVIAETTISAHRSALTLPTLKRLLRQESYSAWRRYQHSTSRLQLCVGHFDITSGLTLLRVEDSDSFVVHEVTGVQTIGASAGRAAFWQNLADETQKQVSVPLAEKPFDYSREAWQMNIAIAVARTCQDGVHQSVGGPILAGAISATGIYGRSYYKIDFSHETPEVTDLSLSESEIQEFQNRNKRSPLPVIRPRPRSQATVL